MQGSKDRDRTRSDLFKALPEFKTLVNAYRGKFLQTQTGEHGTLRTRKHVCISSGIGRPMPFLTFSANGNLFGSNLKCGRYYAGR